MLSGSVGVVEVLLRYGAPPDVRDGMDLTPLHYASLAGSLAMVQVRHHNRGRPHGPL